MTHIASDGSNQSLLVASGTPVPGTDAQTYTASDGTLQEALPVDGAGGGTGPAGPVEWDDVQNKPESVQVDTRNRANHTGTQPASSISDLSDLMAGKVDVVPGKDLSDTNYTQAEKTKLAGIASNESLRDRSTHTGTQTAGTISDLPDILATKVDAVAGKALSDSNYTQAEKDKLAGLEDGHFKGVHVGLAGLTAEHPAAVAGDYAVVDDGVDLTWYQWSVVDAAWTARTGESTEITPAQVKQYYEQNPDTNAFTNDEKTALSNLTSSGRFTLRRRGTWSPITNTPALLDGEGTEGDFYVVTAASSYSFGNGTFVFMPRDWVLFSGGVWQRVAITDSVSTVNGKIGTVALTAADVGAKPSSYTPTWGEITGKPDFDATYAKKLRGTISAPIPALRRTVPTFSTIVRSTVTQITGLFSSGYDQFGIMSGGNLVMPSWATHARVTASARVQALGAGEHARLTATKGSDQIGNACVPGATGAVLGVEMDTGIVPVVGGDIIQLQIWHNGSVDRNLLSTSFLNVELYAAQ